MATWRGQGGAVTVGGANTPLGVSKWEVEESNALAKKTNSTSAGHKQRQGTVRDTAITIELPWDDTTDPDAIGLFPGAIGKCVMNKGESGKKISTNTFIIEKRKFVNDEDEDIVRLVLSGYSNETCVHS